MEINGRAHLIISGRVQGVFYREETRRAAEQAGVSGWVRNLADGTVEALFEGPAAAVETMIAWCHQGSPMARVAEVRVTRETYLGDQSGFVIRR